MKNLGGRGGEASRKAAVFPIVDIPLKKKKNHFLHLIISDILSILL